MSAAYDALRALADEVLAEIPEDGRDLADREAEAVGIAQARLREAPRIVTLDDFSAIEEPGANPLLGAPGEAVIPENGDAMLYGDGGASKTTLSIDLAFHLAAGDPWLGIEVPKPVRVLLIEAEGPRPLFRRKLRQKHKAWQGSDLGDRLLVIESPWADFRFPEADAVADRVSEMEVDVLIAGPVTRVGMDELGTLQQVRDFLSQVTRFRERTGRRLTVLLIHHENKGGTVSGAWEGAGDTLMHATVRGRGRTTLTFQKARWSSEWHKQRLELDWTDGEGFEVAEEQDRDLLAEVSAWLLENPHSTPKEIATKKKVTDENGTRQIKGIGANETAVRELLEGRQDLFRVRTRDEAKAVGRHPSANVWEVRAEVSRGAPEDPAHLGAPTPPGVGEGAGALVRPPYRGAPRTSTPTPTRSTASNPSAQLGAPALSGDADSGEETSWE